MLTDPKETNKKNTDTPLISEQNTDADGSANEDNDNEKVEIGTNHEEGYTKGNPEVEIF